MFGLFSRCVFSSLGLNVRCVCLIKVCADVVVCLCLACFPDEYFRLWV